MLIYEHTEIGLKKEMIRFQLLSYQIYIIERGFIAKSW